MKKSVDGCSKKHSFSLASFEQADKGYMYRLVILNPTKQ